MSIKELKYFQHSGGEDLMRDVFHDILIKYGIITEDTDDDKINHFISKYRSAVKHTLSIEIKDDEYILILVDEKRYQFIINKLLRIYGEKMSKDFSEKFNNQDITNALISKLLIDNILFECIREKMKD